ncbi:MAG: family 43 glycosylhydrolase [Candidatus Hydrogenedentota bacterium]
MKTCWIPFAAIAALLVSLGAHSGEIEAPKPLYRDPVHDGAADPLVIWNHEEEQWFMFYTNRRANLPSDEIDGVSWVHGTRLGIAESSGGANWTYRGEAAINLPPEFGEEDETQWAPEVLEHGGTYHMYLTVAPGIFSDWGHPRDIVHLTSEDLLTWDYESTLDLASDRVIDACVFQLDDGTWRLWYNNERDGKSIYYADSPDLYTWEDRGKVESTSEQPGEGPKVFRWKDAYWMLVDVWNGLAVYRSSNAREWTRQERDLLSEPGKGLDDQVIGQHADVAVSGDRAYLFYFTHPGRLGPDVAQGGAGAVDDFYAFRRSSIQVAELTHEDGALTADRNAPTFIRLQPPE